MKLTERVWFRVIIDLVHDISGPAWIGGVYVLWMVRNAARAVLTPDAFTTVQATWSWILLALLIAIVIQVATGLTRAGYWSAHLDPEKADAKRRTAWVKHAVFGLLFIVAAVEAFVILQP
jgi:putative copper export protein